MPSPLHMGTRPIRGRSSNKITSNVNRHPLDAYGIDQSA
jgi:hypothetical protein